MITRIVFCILTCVLFVSVMNAQDTKSLIKQADAAYVRGEFEESAELYTKAIRMGAAGFIPAYNAARSFAKAGFNDSAFYYIKKSLERGWAYPENMEKEQAFISLHEDPQWDEAIEKAKSNKAMKGPKDKLLNHIKNCAAYALQYRSRPKTAGGGENSYYGFVLTEKYSSNEHGRYTSTVLSTDLLEITGFTPDGKGGITARVDRFGKLSDVTYKGIFK